MAWLGLVLPVAAALLLLVRPDVLGMTGTEPWRPLVVAVAGGALGVVLTVMIVLAYVRLRFASAVRAAERIAAGEADVTVHVPRAGVDARLARAIAGVSQAMNDRHEAATVDRLTGVANRQALLMALFTEVERAVRYDRPLTVAFVDIDHFKPINDTYGHAAGDVVLRGVAQAIKASLRGTDLIGRYGGEEFMLLLAETEVEDGAALAEKLRHVVGALRWDVDGHANVTVTISVGVAGGTGAQLRVDTLVRDADAAMYSAKSLGRNQTYVFAEPDDDARVPRAPISSAGRARAIEVSRAARDAATAALVAIVDPLPHYRGQPSELIASIACEMGRRLDLSETDVERLRVAALLHDIGKVAVPEEILEKPGALTSAEWRSVVQHPRIGQVILEQASVLKDAVPIILHHHERYSGNGYPYGLRGTDIPLGARIVAIADAYDAMIHDRPYKRAVSHDRAIEELQRHAGHQFDPELVALFCDLYEDHAPEPDLDRRAVVSVGGAHGVGHAAAFAATGASAAHTDYAATG